MKSRTPKPSKEERMTMTRDELLRSVWLLDEIIDSFQWIPVENRLPAETQVIEFPSMKPLHKESDMCWVTFDTKENLYTGLDYTVDGEWVQNDDVIAWMPLPEPYNPQN